MDYYFLLAFIAAICISALNLLVKKTLVGTTTFSSLTIRSFITTLLTGVTYLALGNKNLPTISEISLTIFAAVLGYLGLCALFKAFSLSDKPSLIAGLGNSNSILVAIFGSIFFGNVLGFNSILAICITICGLFITIANFGDIKNSSIFKVSSGIPFVFVQMVFWGIAWNLYGIMGSKVDPFLVLFIIEVVNFVLSLAIALILDNRIIFPPVRVLSLTFISSILIWIGFGSQVYAMSHANPGLVSTIVSSDSIFAVLFGRIFLKEKLNPQQYLGMFIFFIGIVMIRII
jgi:drug/metabolite transporter (DMT)-like permease